MRPADVEVSGPRARRSVVYDEAVSDAFLDEVLQEATLIDLELGSDDDLAPTPAAPLRKRRSRPPRVEASEQKKSKQVSPSVEPDATGNEVPPAPVSSLPYSDLRFLCLPLGYS